MVLKSNIIISRNTKNKIKLKPNIPIILIPGILGTRLKSAQNPNGIWDPENTDLMLKKHVVSSSDYQRKLFKDNNIEVMIDSDRYDSEKIQRGWGEVYSEIYKPFLMTCQNKSFTYFTPKVYAIGYNWIKSNRDSCDRIRNRTKWILEKEKSGKTQPKGFFYVTHSMGALTVRSVLKKYNDLANNCLGVIFIVPPNLGAVVFYRRFFTGVKYDDLKVALVMGDHPSKWAKAVSPVKSAFELLPNNEYASNGENKRQWLRWKAEVVPEKNKKYLGEREKATPPANELYEIYSHTDYIACIAHNSWGNVREDIINNTKDARLYFNDWLADYMPDKFGIICSNNITTDTEVDISATINISYERGHISKINGNVYTPSIVRSQKLNIFAKPFRDKRGDGTVPINSQLAFKKKSISCIEFDSVKHADAIKNKEVMSKIFELLDEMYS
jgi:hypothetical protein